MLQSTSAEKPEKKRLKVRLDDAYDPHLFMKGGWRRLSQIPLRDTRSADELGVRLWATFGRTELWRRSVPGAFPCPFRRLGCHRDGPHRAEYGDSEGQWGGLSLPAFTPTAGGPPAANKNAQRRKERLRRQKSEAGPNRLFRLWAIHRRQHMTGVNLQVGGSTAKLQYLTESKRGG